MSDLGQMRTVIPEGANNATTSSGVEFVLAVVYIVS